MLNSKSSATLWRMWRRLHTLSTSASRVKVLTGRQEYIADRLRHALPRIQLDSKKSPQAMAKEDLQLEMDSINLHALDIPPTVSLSARVEHILVKEPGLLTHIIAAELSLPQVFDPTNDFAMGVPISSCPSMSTSGVRAGLCEGAHTLWGRALVPGSAGERTARLRPSARRPGC